MKDILIGKADIKELLSKNFIYVDKTEYIYNLIRIPDCYFLSRPRRFGKSLLVSTLFEIFSGNKELFKDCWIYNTNYDWKSYPIIHLDFGDKKQELRKNFYDVLFNKLKKISKFYELSINDNSVTEYFSSLIEELYKKMGKIVFLIDEYDKPILDSIDDLEMANENREVLGGIFSTAKSLSKMIHFQFITGITRFAKTSLFSGPNNPFDISNSSDFSILLGYTQKELEFYFQDYINIALKNNNNSIKDKNELLNKIQNWYNGYKFSCMNDQVEKVYNPFSLSNFFLNKGFFNNYWFKSGTPTFLIKLLKKYNYNKALDENNIFLTMYELDKFEIHKINLISLLFQAGYLTIESYNEEKQEIKLKYPSEEVRGSFINIIKDIVVENAENIDPKLKIYLNNEDWSNVYSVIRSFIASNPFIKHKSRDEHDYSSWVHMIFKGTDIECRMEDNTNHGIADMIFFNNNKIYIIEFKMNKSAKIAIEQIRLTKYFEKFLIYDLPIVLIGINFSSLERNIVELIAENL